MKKILTMILLAMFLSVPALSLAYDQDRTQDRDQDQDRIRDCSDYCGEMDGRQYRKHNGDSLAYQLGDCDMDQDKIQDRIQDRESTIIS